MNSLIKLGEATERGPAPPEDHDRIFLRLSDKWALGYDRLQWIVMRWKGKAKGWRPISFVASNKEVLVRVLKDDGAELTPEAQAALDRLPDTFKEWLAEQDRRTEAA
ncbi:MAG: hypothetical protein QGH32_05640 [Alphaproteobacteria bacterium]|jgi:hypothetical protein|nr:hypothetical protein [Alphaproteobacteria bacterium]|tara:strand:+ start:2530 stop:2850 length:321 start_codon:yes stop_codon:yes gene_type:complete